MLESWRSALHVRCITYVHWKLSGTCGPESLVHGGTAVILLPEPHNAIVTVCNDTTEKYLQHIEELCTALILQRSVCAVVMTEIVNNLRFKRKPAVLAECNGFSVGIEQRNDGCARV